MATFILDGIPRAVRSAIAPGRYTNDQSAPIYDALLEGLEGWLKSAVTSLHRRNALIAVADYVASCLAPLQRSFFAGAFADFANLRPVLTTSVTGARYLLEETVAYADGRFPVSSKKLTELHAPSCRLSDPQEIRMVWI